MPIFCVYEPEQAAVADRARRAEFVVEKFSLWAYVLPPAWMVWNGMWRMLLVYLGINTALGLGLSAMGATQPVMLASEMMLSLLAGLEAANLRRWSLQWRGWRETGVISAANRDEAELRYFADWTGIETVSSAHQTVLSLIAGKPAPVVGLFPHAGGRA